MKNIFFNHSVKRVIPILFCFGFLFFGGILTSRAVSSFDPKQFDSTTEKKCPDIVNPNEDRLYGVFYVTSDGTKENADIIEEARCVLLEQDPEYQYNYNFFVENKVLDKKISAYDVDFETRSCSSFGNWSSVDAFDQSINSMLFKVYYKIEYTRFESYIFFLNDACKMEDSSNKKIRNHIRYEFISPLLSGDPNFYMYFMGYHLSQRVIDACLADATCRETLPMYKGDAITWTGVPANPDADPLLLGNSKMLIIGAEGASEIRCLNCDSVQGLSVSSVASLGNSITLLFDSVEWQSGTGTSLPASATFILAGKTAEGKYSVVEPRIYVGKYDCSLLNKDKDKCAENRHCFYWNNQCSDVRDNKICNTLPQSMCGVSSGGSVEGSEICVWNPAGNRGTGICDSRLDKGLSDTHAKPAGYKGPLPDCAFAGSCTNVNDLVELAVNIAEFLFGIIGVLALLMFVYGGFMIVISAGSPERVKTGQGALVGAVIGLVISFSAYLLISFVLDAYKVGPDFRAVDVTRTE